MMAEEESDYSDSEQEESEEEEGGEEEGVVGRSVTDKLYTPVPFHGDFSRPFGLKTALLIRGMRGGVIVLDTSGSVFTKYDPLRLYLRHRLRLRLTLAVLSKVTQFVEKKESLHFFSNGCRNI